MNQKLWAAALGALLAVPLASLAQQSSRTPDPADPAAAVMPIVYESAFIRPAQPAQDRQPTPDKTWRAANDAVANPSVHAGLSAPNAAKETAGDKNAGPPAAVRADTAAAPAEPTSVDHGKHHNTHH